MNFHETLKLLGASASFVLSTVLSLSQIAPSMQKDAVKPGSTAVKEPVVEKSETMIKIELRAMAQNRKLDSLEQVFDSTAVILKESIEEKKELEKVLDETNVIQQKVINKIPLLIRAVKPTSQLKVNFRVRLVEGVGYRIDPKPVELPRVATPCPEKPSFFRRIFFRHRK